MSRAVIEVDLMDHIYDVDTDDLRAELRRRERAEIYCTIADLAGDLREAFFRRDTSRFEALLARSERLAQEKDE